MKVTLAIPSYWGREKGVGWREGDAIYDHPTPSDEEGTLLRAIQSVAILKDKDFQLVILVVPTSEDIATEVERKVANIIRSAPAIIGVEVLPFGPSHLKQIHNLFISDGKKEYTDLLQLRGYSNVRNLCMFIPHRNLFTRVPFDPKVPKGEDIDFLINAKMFAQALDKSLKGIENEPSYLAKRDNLLDITDVNDLSSIKR